jgi:hypothetical protein
MRKLGTIFALMMGLWILPNIAEAQLRLVVESESVPVFSGPSFRFRQIASLPPGAKLVVSNTLAKSVDGEFYKVVVDRPYFNRRRVGYVLANSAVRLEGQGKIENEVDRHQLNESSGVGLSSKALLIGFVFYRDTLQIWSVGYQRDFSAGAFLKIWGGQLLTAGNTHTVLGTDIGVEHFLTEKLSLTSLTGIGAIFSPKKDLIFPGSKSYSALVQGGFGLRYSADEEAAFSLSLLQSAFFGPNGSELRTGIGAAIEVGL